MPIFTFKDHKYYLQEQAFINLRRTYENYIVGSLISNQLSVKITSQFFNHKI